MRDLTLKNLSGVNVKITLWGDSMSELSRNLDQARDLVATTRKRYCLVVEMACQENYLCHQLIPPRSTLT
ncbi:hypothetical protein MKW92_028921 [Papaver armeniacum]|nr:hypothetical protein MKW92_028921 [Papaver armeniacum]